MTKVFSKNQTLFIETAYTQFADKFDVNNIDRHDLQEIADAAGVSFPQWLTTTPAYKVSRGFYMIPAASSSPEEKSVWGDKTTKVKATKVKATKTKATKVKATRPTLPIPPFQTEEKITTAEPAAAIALAKGSNDFTNIPEKLTNYVPFGSFKDVFSIVKSGKFFPVFVSGLSGNGKTLMVEQACAKAKRNLYRVNITIETDEDDLLGGFRLVNGETVWFDGPVVEAMKTGSLLLLDEVDLGSTKLMCLQPVLEGKGVFLKKINEWVTPIAGFNVCATANTKGKGDDSGNYIGAGVLNEAFLERFPITIEQQYPAPAIEKKILKGEFAIHGIEDDTFADNLVDWADLIRKAYAEDSVDDIITTRRLIHITEAYSIFKDKMKAIDMCISRFDDLSKTVFRETYTKIDADINTDDTEKVEDGSCPF